MPRAAPVNALSAQKMDMEAQGIKRVWRKQDFFPSQHVIQTSATQFHLSIFVLYVIGPTSYGEDT